MVKNPPANAVDVGDTGLIPGSGRSPGGGNGNPTPVFLPGKFYGQRTLAGCVLCPWKCRVRHDGVTGLIFISMR